MIKELEKFTIKIKQFKEKILDISQTVGYHLKCDIDHFKKIFLEHVEKIFDDVHCSLLQEFNEKKMNLEKNLDLAMNTFEREKLRIERHGLGSKQDLINALNGAIKAPDYFAKLSSEHFKNISIVHRCQQENPLFNHYVSQLCPLNSIEDFLVEYDNVLKYPKDPLVDKLDNLKHSVEANIKSYFKERDNYTRAKRKFPPIPNIETEEKTIDYKLEVRTKANKVVFSNLLELKDSTSHILEDIGEMNVLFQQ